VFYNKKEIFYISLFSFYIGCNKKKEFMVKSMLNTKHIVRHYSNKLSSKYKKEYKLTPNQIDARPPSGDGDGFLERLKPTSNTRLRVEQVYPSQAEFV
jgi:hypothetical protein